MLALGPRAHARTALLHPPGSGRGDGISLALHESDLPSGEAGLQGWRPVARSRDHVDQSASWINLLAPYTFRHPPMRDMVTL